MKNNQSKVKEKILGFTWPDEMRTPHPNPICLFGHCFLLGHLFTTV